MALIIPAQSYAAFPDAPVIDDANRGAEDPATGWTVWQGNGIAISGSNTFTTSGAGDNGSYRTGTDYGPDVEVGIDLVDTVGGDFMELQFRLVDFGGGGDGYACGYSKSASELAAFRIDNGGYTQLGAAISQTISDGDFYRCTMIGSTITLYYKVGAGSWTSMGTRTDGTYTAAGKVGLNISAGTLSADNFAAVTLSGGGGGPATTPSLMLMGVGGLVRLMSATRLTQGHTRRNWFKTLLACFLGGRK